MDTLFHYTILQENLLIAITLVSLQNCLLFGSFHCWEVLPKYSNFENCWLYGVISDEKGKEYRLHSVEQSF